MKSLPVFLRSPARAVIAVDVIVLVVEFLIMLLIEGVFNTIGISKIPNIFLTLIDPLILIALISPVLYILVFRQQLDELRRNEQLASLIDAIPDAVVLKDGEGRWLNINEPARQMFKLHNLPWEGKTGKELADMNPALRARHERCVASDEKAWQAGRLQVGEESVVGADGRCAIIEERKMPMFNEGGQRKGLATIGRDITERRAAQARIEHLTKLYQARSKINQAIVRMDDESTLLPLVCQVAVDLGGTRLAWIGRLNEASGLIEPVVIYGSGAEYLNGIVVSSKQDVPEGRGPSAIAFRESHNVVVNNIQTSEMTKPWQELALRYDLRSCGSFPISRAGKPFAVFTVYHSQPDAFDAEMIRLLDEMSHDISFALDSFDREKERRQTQEELIDSEHHFRAYFERAMVGMAATSPVKGWLEANEALCTMLGYSREELMCLTWGKLTHPDDLAANEILFNRVLRGEIDEYAMDKRFIRKDGTIVYVHIAVRALRRADGSVDYIVALVEDISERKHREAEIIASEERLSTLIEAIPDAVFLKDGEGRWLITNEPAKQMFQLHALPWQGKTEMELADMHPVFRAAHEGYLASDEEAWQAGHLLVGEESVTREDGRCAIIEARKVPLFSQEGQRQGLVVIGRDITKQRQAENHLNNLSVLLKERVAALTASEASLAQAQAQAHLGSCSLNLSNNEVLWSDELYRIFGLELHAPLNRDNFLAGVHPDDRRRVKETVDAAIGGKCCNKYAMDYRIVLPDGNQRVVHEEGKISCDETGKAASIFGTAQDITERKQHEERLFNTNELMERIFANIRTLIAYMDADFNFIRVNQAYAATDGHSPDYFVGKNHFDLFPNHENEQIFREVVASGQPYVVFAKPFVYEHNQERGISYWDWTIQPVKDTEGHVNGLVLSLLDRTGEKRAEETLRLYGRAIDASMNSIMIVDVMQPEHPAIFVNPAFTSMTGYSAEEVLGRRLRILVGSDWEQPGIENIRGAVREKRGDHAVLRNYRKDGSLFWCELFVSPILGESGEVTHLIAVAQDISERKLQEAELIAANDRLSTLINAIPDAVFFKDGEGRWLIINEPAKQMFQLHDLPWQGKTEMELAELQPSFRAAHEGCLAGDEKAWQAGKLLVGEEILTGEEGQCAIIETRKMPLFGQAGQRKGLVVIGRDITERKNSVVAMLNLNRDLSESRQRLRGLAAQNEEMRESERKHIAREVHDELGQVLTALRMDISLIDMRFGSLDPAVTDKVMDMRKLVDRAIQGVRNVAMNLRPPALDMGLVPAIHWLSNEFSRNTTIECLLNVRQGHIDLDEARAVVVFRIVQESLTNVTRYAEASLVNITIGHRGNELWVEVRDNGRGFDVDAVTKGKSFGLLGMRERALALGGQVNITSVLGQGTVIGLMIPIELDSAEEKQ